MRLIETLTKEEFQNIAIATDVDIQSVGLFNYMFHNEDTLHSIKGELCRGYFLGHSGKKRISSYYSQILELANEGIIDNPSEIVGSMVRSKFKDKWEKVYADLILEYNPLQEYDFSEHKEADNTDTKTYDLTTSNEGTSSDENISVANGSDKDSIYAFNSQAPSNANLSVENSSDTNKSESEFENSETKTGTETFGITRDETKTTQGRKASASLLLKAELDFRAKNILFDIIYSDIDSIVASQIYER